MRTPVAMRVGILLVIAVLAASCGNEPVSTAAACFDPLVGTYVRRMGPFSRGAMYAWELHLSADCSAALRKEFNGSPSSFEGTWERDGDFVVLKLHQVGLDPELIRKMAERLGRPDYTTEYIESVCWVYLAEPTTGGLDFYVDSVCYCEEEIGDLRKLLRPVVFGPVLLRCEE